MKEIEILREKALETMRLLAIERKKAEAHELRALTAQAGFWDDREKAVEISQRADELEKETGAWDGLLLEIRSLEELVAESAELDDNTLSEEAHSQYAKLKKDYERLEFYVMFSHKYDPNNAVISIHAGTGGVDAQDWAEILERMFLRFVEKKGWKA